MYSNKHNKYVACDIDIGYTFNIGWELTQTIITSMKLYHITKNGFKVGQARGKRKAVDFINTLLSQDDRCLPLAIFENDLHTGMSISIQGKLVYKIEENKGDL